MSKRMDEMNVIKGYVKAAHSRGDEVSRLLNATEWLRRATEAEKRKAPKFITRGPH